MPPAAPAAAPGPGQPAVVSRGVVKRFGTGEAATLALKGVDMEARYGELMMIVGPSGCGKTTLLSVLCGTLRADEGDVELFGNKLSAMSDRRITDFRRDNIGFIFQQFNLIPTLTAVENASVPLLLAGKGRRAAERRAAEILTEVGLGDRLRHRPTQLSGGQQQRVAIARALVHDPRLIISDEPTASLDAASGQKVLELMKELSARPDRCVIVVTHDNRIFPFADRVTEMEDGRILDVHASGYTGLESHSPFPSSPAQEQPPPSHV